MNKLITILAVTLAVNLFAASKKKAANQAPVAKPATEQPALTQPEAAPAASEAVTAPQVNPQPAPVPAAETTASVTTQDAGKLTGTLDLRPSHTGDSAQFKTENAVDIGYKTGNDHFIFEQDFNTNIYNPNATAETSGLNFEIRDAFFRWKRANLWQSDDKVYSLSYELRPYLPTVASKRDAGMITAVRNYAKFSAQVSDSVALSLWEIPIAHLYNRAGTELNGVSTPNPGFENRVYLMADWSITDQWSLSFPLMLNSQRSREFNGILPTWGHYVWTNPELDYAVTSNYTLGISWYNDRSFMASDLSTIDISDGLKSGVTQLVLRATL